MKIKMPLSFCFMSKFYFEIALLTRRANGFMRGNLSHCRRVITPSASTAIHNVQLAIKDTNLPKINISYLKNCTKIPHDTDVLRCQPKIFH
jgi:hypothetical protein